MTDSTKPMFGLDNLNSLLKSICTDYERRMIQKLSKRGFDNFNISYYSILNSLNSSSTPLIRAVLAKNRGISEQAMGKSIRLMEIAGYLSLKKNDSDARSNDIVLTKSGNQVILALIEINEEIEAEYVGGLSVAREQIINKMTRNLELIAKHNDIKLMVF